jgi:uncharacterized protein (TIGR02678 family)
MGLGSAGRPTQCPLRKLPLCTLRSPPLPPRFKPVHGGGRPGAGFYAPTPEGELKARRHHIFRRLLQEPVVYDWEWTELERHYVLTQRHYLRQQLETMAGLVGQRYREGLLFFYPEASGEMELFPTARAISDLVQALAAEIRRRAAGDTEPAVDERGCLALTRLEFETLLFKLRQRYGDYWSKQHRQATTSQLGEEIIEHLEQWGLGRQGKRRHCLFATGPGSFLGPL